MVVISPGGFYFGYQGESMRTLLGSCVAVTLWHPKKQIGGMCHFLLPSNNGPGAEKGGRDGRYGDEAMALFMRELLLSGTRAQEYQVKVFGGGDMFPHLSQKGINIGQRNIEAARSLLRQRHFHISGEHVGQSGHRSVILELSSGATWVRWKE